MVFVVRTVLLAPAWILMRRGTPWLLAGASPMQRVVPPSHPAAAAPAAAAPGGTQTQTRTPARARNPYRALYTSSVVSVVRFQDQVDQAAKHAVDSRSAGTFAVNYDSSTPPPSFQTASHAFPRNDVSCWAMCG